MAATTTALVPTSTIDYTTIDELINKLDEHNAALLAETNPGNKKVHMENIKTIQRNLNQQVAILLASDSRFNERAASATSQNVLTRPSREPTSSFLNTNVEMGGKCYNLNNNPVSGEKCLELITKCMSGNKDGCVEEFNKLDWASSVNMNDVKLEFAEQLLSSMGVQYSELKDKAIADWVSKLGSDAVKQKIVKNTSLINFLNKLVKKVNYPDVKQYDVTTETTALGIPVRLPRFANTRNLNLVGGGRNIVSNTFTQFINSIKYRASMTGGAHNIADDLHYSYEDFNRLLKQHNKAIDPADNENIRSLINNIRNLEGKLNRVSAIATRFRMLHNSPTFKKLLDEESSSELSLEKLEEIETKHAALKNVFTGKVESISGILLFIQEQLPRFAVKA
jgi:hypothetical protein